MCGVSVCVHSCMPPRPGIRTPCSSTSVSCAKRGRECNPGGCGNHGPCTDSHELAPTDGAALAADGAAPRATPCLACGPPGAAPALAAEGAAGAVVVAGAGAAGAVVAGAGAFDGDGDSDDDYDDDDNND